MNTMKFIVATIIGLAFFLSPGCAVGPHATTQQIVDAQNGNAFIAHAARLSFEGLATKIAKKYDHMTPGNQKIVDDAEDGMKSVLDQMDVAAAGDPNAFAKLSGDAAWRQFTLSAQFAVIDLLTSGA